MSRRASHRPQHEIEGLEYALEGGWLDAVSNLSRWLRAAGCFEYVHRLEREVQSISPSSRPPAERVALRAIRDALARLYNDPPQHLTPEQYRELSALRRQATRFVQYRLRHLPSAQASTEQAARNVAARLAALATAETPAAAGAGGRARGTVSQTGTRPRRLGGALGPRHQRRQRHLPGPS
jgi:hypothetical protein